MPWVILMNLCRVIAGVHWPFDILAGTIVWIFSAIISFKYLIGNKFVKNINLFIIKTLSYIKL
jgi:membrane-associated phospholipid phosphatase